MGLIVSYDVDETGHLPGRREHPELRWGSGCAEDGEFREDVDRWAWLPLPDGAGGNAPGVPPPSDLIRAAALPAVHS